MVFVDDEGLEEQFLTDEETANRSEHLGKPCDNTCEYKPEYPADATRRT